MKTATLCIFLIITMFSSGFAQHGEYVRSSISSVESVWIKPGAEKGISLNYPFFEKMVEHYIEMARFDYNELPESLLSDFRTRANELPAIDESAIADLLEETVAREILAILNDPEVMQNRGLALRDESAWQTFAATKARSIGLTIEELEILMNSAYIYLPFIRSIELTDSPPLTRRLTGDSDNHYVNIEGGIVWFSVNVAPDGEVEISELLAVSAEAYGSAEKGKRHTFRFGNERTELSSSDYALYDATQAWVRNLSVKTQEVPEFQLQAGIVEVLRGGRYSLGIGRQEGVYLDDMYELVEVHVNSEGQEEYQRVGFTRITNVGDNTEDHYNYSTATQLLGRSQGVGVIAREYPRVGYDLRIKLGVSQGIEIPATEFHWLLTDITETFDLDISYAYNLAPITGTSQSFLSLDLGFGFPMEYETRPDIDVTAFTGHAYLGYTKKFWFAGRHNIGMNLGAGTDAFRYSFDSDNSLTLFAPGGRAGLDYEILLSPALSFNMGAGYKYTFDPFWASWEVNGSSVDFPVSDTEMFLGGTYMTAGFNYSLRQIGFNLFGFLDGLRSY